MSTEEKRPFFEDVGDDDSLSGSSLQARPSKNKSYALTVSVLANVILLITCVLLSVTVLLLSKSPSSVDLSGQDVNHGQLAEPYSPANRIIEYEYRYMDFNASGFTGRPGPAWEQAMHGLMEGTLLRASEDELEQYGSDSIPLRDGGYAVGLGVGHNLHCVSKLKKFLYREQFYAHLDPNGSEFEYEQSHADHCLDFLRQSIMCHIDYSMYTLYWGERRQDIPTHRMPGVQRCVSWDKLHEWMMDRAASADMLIGP